MTSAGDRGLAGEQHLLGVGAQPVGCLGQQADGEPAGEQQRRQTEAARAFALDPRCEAPDGGDRQRCEDADGNRHQQVGDVRAVVERQTGLGQSLAVQAAPAAEAHEQDVAESCRDEARDQHRQQRRPESQTALDHQHPADDRAAEQRRDSRERAGAAEYRALALSHSARRGGDHAGDRAERDQRASGPRTAPKPSVPTAASTIPGPCGIG